MGIEGRIEKNRSGNRRKNELDISREKRGEWSEWNNKWRKKVGIEMNNGREVEIEGEIEDYRNVNKKGERVGYMKEEIRRLK